MAALSLIVRELHEADLAEAARLVARGMRDNPSNIRAFRISDADRRSWALSRFFAPVLHGLYRRGLILGAFRDASLVGVCGIARPGLCQPTALEKLQVLPSIVFRNPVSTPLRVLTWVRAWARLDPQDPHWHLGPVAVEPDLQGQGIGSAMLADFSTRVDDSRGPAYLETDKADNVLFYQKFGFTVIAEAEILGVPNWFMSRSANGTPGPPPHI